MTDLEILTRRVDELETLVKGLTLAKHRSPSLSSQAVELYGVALSAADVARMVDYIATQSDAAVFVHRISNNRTVWEVEHLGVRLRVVYAKGRIAEVLPPDWCPEGGGA